MTNETDFILAVAHEIKILKLHATAEELNKLSVNNFSSRGKSTCIYGQITGHCESLRAKELIDICCNKELDISDDNRFRSMSYYSLTDVFDNLIKIRNYTGKTWKSNTGRDYDYLSALEGYIQMQGAKNKHIIEFLKDTTNTLKLNLVY